LLEGVTIAAAESIGPDLLLQLQPVAVVMFDPELTWVRVLEVYQAERGGLLGSRVPPLQVLGGV
jgi:hypothetical protein